MDQKSPINLTTNAFSALKDLENTDEIGPDQMALVSKALQGLNLYSTFMGRRDLANNTESESEIEF